MDDFQSEMIFAPTTELDRKARLWSRIRFGLFCSYSAGVIYLCLKLSPIHGLLMFPLAAWMFARYAVPAIVERPPAWIRQWRFRGWHGNYYEFDGRQIRIDDFGGSLDTMPLIASRDLERVLDNEPRFRIPRVDYPQSGPLKGIAAIRADRSVIWARAIARSNCPQADRARKLALFIERTLTDKRDKAVNKLESMSSS